MEDGLPEVRGDTAEVHPSLAACAEAHWGQHRATHRRGGARHVYIGGFIAGWLAAASRLEELADGRDKYTPDPAGHLEFQTSTARDLARYLRDPEQAWGWLPSWLWAKFGLRG
ncbi:MAG TPA: hypothetical protein VL043_11845 [Protaetiibacter sp.]|nr:hypothetical protein [Protaetiibacter sp.]